VSRDPGRAAPAVTGCSSPIAPATRAVFLYGFAKNERENIGSDELLTLREIGSAWLAADAARIAQALKDEALQEVADDEEA
jgi:hypothetical protein